MLVCEVTDGIVTNLIELPDNYVIASDRKSAAGIATYEVQGPEGSEIVDYDAGYAAHSGALLFVADPDAEPGWTYAAGVFAPPPEEPDSPKRQFSFLEFMDLFTGEEQLAIAGAAMTDAATKLWYDRAVGAQFISLDDARLTAGLDAMVTAGLLTAPRSDRVMQGLPPEA
nr:hypothetical protein [Methylobacterium sp. ZNC0032]